MRRILIWLQTKFSKQSAVHEAEKFRMPVGVRVTPKEISEEEDDEYAVKVGFNPEESGRIEDHGLGKNDSAEAIAVPEIEILDDVESEDSRECGFNPYDTGCIDTTKW